MSDIAIRVDGLGKQYRLGAQQSPYRTLGDQIRKWTSLRSLLRRRDRTENNPPFWALKDVSFEVKKGEVVGIIGRNGAGKSTLLKILSRITEPTEGTVDLFGRVGSLLEVGTGFHPELTGRENIYLNGAILGMKRVEITRKFDEIVAFAEVEKFIDTPVKHYSSGMYMRLAFAVAAHLEPEILIVDEVLAVGDAEFQKKCLGKMGDVAKQGRTVLFVSHNITAIQVLCKLGIVLRSGRLIACGSTSESIQHYLDFVDSKNCFNRIVMPNTIACVHSASINVTQNNCQLLLEVTTNLMAKKELTIGIDIRIDTLLGAPVGFASLGGFNQEHAIKLEPGFTQIVSIYDISNLANGNYSISIDITNPAVLYHDRVAHCLTFEIAAVPREGCFRRLEQSWGIGSMEIPYLSFNTKKC